MEMHGVKILRALDDRTINQYLSALRIGGETAVQKAEQLNDLGLIEEEFDESEWREKLEQEMERRKIETEEDVESDRQWSEAKDEYFGRVL